MKPLGAVRHKFKQAAFRHLKKRLGEYLAVRPENCTFNVVKVRSDGQRVGMCRCPAFSNDQWPGECDNRLTPDRPSKCGQFQPPEKEILKDEFREFLSSAPLHEVAAEYPDLAALLWVLGEDAVAREAAMGPETEWPQDEPEPEPEPLSEGVTVEVMGVPVLVPDETEAAKLRAHLDVLVQGFREELSTAKEASEGYREVADRLQQEKNTAEAERARLQQEKETTASLLRETEAAMTALEQQVQAARKATEIAELELVTAKKAPAMPVVVSPAPLDVPQGFWARLRFLFGGVPHE